MRTDRFDQKTFMTDKRYKKLQIHFITDNHRRV